MENRAYALAAGLFALLLGASALVAAMWFSGETYERVGYVLESGYAVTGLNIQAPVRLRGVDVGKVDKIEFDAEDRRLILISISVRRGTPITRGTVAQLGSQGVTGLSYVMLEDDGTKPELLQPSSDKAARIQVRQAFFDELTGSGRDLLSEVHQVARRFNVLLGERNQQQLIRTLATLEEATVRITTLAHAVEPGMKGLPALTADARKTLRNANVLLGSLDDLSRQLAQRLDTLERVAKSAEQVASSAQSVSGAAEGEVMPRINALLEELARNSRSLDRLLTELNELTDQPHSLVFGRPPAVPGPGEPGFSPQHGSSQK
jgi:phospholipid/cholesterol/gamma-HCH transport system substrate-binding protein